MNSNELQHLILTGMQSAPVCVRAGRAQRARGSEQASRTLRVEEGRHEVKSTFTHKVWASAGLNRRTKNVHDHKNAHY